MMLSGQARLAGVMGWPVGHSLSPALHGFWIEQLRLDAAYVPLPVKPEDLGAVVSALPRMGFRGANVTLPHKETVLRHADHVDHTAVACGAANTLVVVEGKIHAFNTDVSGYVASLHAAGVRDLEGRRAVVLGAGGAARAVVHGLLTCGISNIAVANRTVANASALADFFGPKVRPVAWSDVQSLLPDCFLLVNTTKLGMVGEADPDVALQSLGSDAVVSDIVYRPLETKLLSDARRRGLKTVDGLGMLLHQAVPGFEAWFGIRPEVSAALRAHLVAFLERR